MVAVALSPGALALGCYAIAFAGYGVARWLELGDALFVIELDGE